MKEIAHLERLARLMDASFTLPGTNIRMGLDGLVGFIPGIGDTIGLAVAAYIVVRAHKLGVPTGTLAHMIWNIFIDWLIGLVPLVGDFFDIAFKANLKNIALLKEALETRQPGYVEVV